MFLILPRLILFDLLKPWFILKSLKIPWVNYYYWLIVTGVKSFNLVYDYFYSLNVDDIEVAKIIKVVFYLFHFRNVLSRLNGIFESFVTFNLVKNSISCENLFTISKNIYHSSSIITANAFQQEDISKEEKDLKAKTSNQNIDTFFNITCLYEFLKDLQDEDCFWDINHLSLR